MIQDGRHKHVCTSAKFTEIKLKFGEIEDEHHIQHTFLIPHFAVFLPQILATSFGINYVCLLVKLS